MKQWQMAVVMLLLVSGQFTPAICHAGRDRPVRIGALTASWGPTPQMAGLRDGLLALGYHEDEDFFLGVRFTQGNPADLPAAARELVQYGVDIIFTDGVNATKAAQAATRQIPIVFTADDPTCEWSNQELRAAWRKHHGGDRSGASAGSKTTATVHGDNSGSTTRYVSI